MDDVQIECSCPSSKCTCTRNGKVESFMASPGVCTMGGTSVGCTLTDAERAFCGVK
jgi:hypothetical protein